LSLGNGITGIGFGCTGRSDSHVSNCGAIGHAFCGKRLFTGAVLWAQSSSFWGIIFVFLLVWLIILIAFTMMPGSSYVAIHERLYSTGIAERQANLAVSFGLTPAARSVSPLLLGMGLGLWLFQGGHFAVQGVTEAGSSSKGQILGALFGSVVTAVILFVALLGWQKQVPAALLSAHSWLYLKKSPLCNSSFPGRLTIG